jgi:formamidopyrimidine-DNA glycosylase
MTGKWIKRVKGEAPPSHVRASFEFEGRVMLDYRDPRLFGRLLAGLTEELRKHPTLLGLGPDPLGGIDIRSFTEALQKTHRSIKEALMDQRTLAGLGNIQVSESLHRAKLHPERESASLDRGEIERLAKSIDESLRFTLAHEKGEEPIEYVEEGGANFFLVYGRAGEPCHTCKTPLQRIVQGGRSTFFCPHCQPEAATHRPRRTTPPSPRPPAPAAAKTKARAAPKGAAKKTKQPAKKAAKAKGPAKRAAPRLAKPAKPAAGRSSARGK